MLLQNWLQAVLPEDWQHGGFGLYIHWPFCQSKCPYCDFNSHVSKSVDQKQWAKAYCSEINRLGAETQGRSLKSIFFGGGTPSLMDPDTVDTILRKVRETWSLSNTVEITLEANPTSVEAGRFSGYKDAGVNRVSIGIQALNDDDLRRLGRLHTVNEAQAAFEVAAGLFDRISFDLIYARQDQTLEAWESELNEALAMAADHLSLYQLTIEGGTAFGDRLAAGRLKGLPNEDLAADMYQLTQDLTSAAGLSAYEVSNHAKTDAESRHNLIYWQCGDYAGIGPGAHGRLTLGGVRYETESPKNPQVWLNNVLQTGSGELPRKAQAPHEHADEYLMMGLRITDGIELERYENVSRTPIDANKINGLIDIGVLSMANGRLFATPRGRPLLNAIIRELLTE
ncbi:MAG: coproporphyrinogen III oxidase [Marinosulfonomonas sp.]|nr:MAG: coproporphyrinogen III oxidase [Marinosulfonomonas sp.]